jgi:hypothetical protein
MKGGTIARQGLFAMATTFTLGFGAREALAAPGAQAEAGAYCTATWAAKCNQICTDRGYDYGVCQEPGSCVCGFYPLEE